MEYPFNGLKFPQDWESKEFSNKVLVSDDDREINELIRSILEREKLESIAAYSGRETLQKIIEHKPKVVVLDMMLPKGSGFLVIEKVMEIVKDKEKPPYIIMITANEGKRHEMYARHLGVSEYINKPFPNERIVEFVKKYYSK